MVWLGAGDVLVGTEVAILVVVTVVVAMMPRLIRIKKGRVCIP